MSEILFAFRRWRRALPLHVSIGATVALAVVGASLAATIVDAVLLRPVGVPDADRIVGVFSVDDAGGEMSGVSPAAIDLVNELPHIQAAAYIEETRERVTGCGDPTDVLGAVVSPGFFEVFTGRRALWAPEGTVATGNALAMRCGLAPGSAVRLGESSLAVVESGLPRDFAYPRGLQFWAPRPRGVADTSSPGMAAGVGQGVARLRAGATVEQAQAALDARVAALPSAMPPDRRLLLQPLTAFLAGPYVGAVSAVFVASAVVVAVAVINVAQLAAALLRRRRNEWAIAVAIGGSRRRILRGLTLEAAVGATVALLPALTLTIAGLRVWSRSDMRFVLELDRISLDWPAVAFLVVCTYGAYAAGLLLPTLLMLRTTTAVGLSAMPDQHRRGVAGQIGLGVQAAAAIALCVLGLGLIRGVRELQRPVFAVDADAVHTAVFRLDPARYPDGPSRLQFYRNVVSRLTSASTDMRVALTSHLPTGAGHAGRGSLRASTADGHVEVLAVRVRIVTPEFFETLRIPMLSGAGLPSAGATSRHAAVFSRSLAARVDATAGSNRFELRRGRMAYELEVTGVAADITPNPWRDAEPTIYLSHAQVPASEMAIVLAANMASRDADALLRRVVASVDPLEAVLESRSLGAAQDRSTRATRLLRAIFLAFAVVSALLAVVGLYGAVRAAADERVFECAVRAALGATPARIVLFLTGRYWWWVVAGCSAGAIAVVVATPALTKLLWGYRSPPTMATVIAVLVAIVVMGAMAVRGASVVRYDALVDALR